MKKLLVLPAVLALTPIVGNAALTFNVDGIGPDATPVASGGAVGVGDDGIVTAVYSDTGLNGASSGTMTITLTGLTLDGNGADDDSAVMNFTITSTGGAINHTTDLGVTGNGAGRISDVSEILTFSFSSGSVTLGAGASPSDVGTLDFIGFNQIDLTQFQADGAPDDIASLSLGGVAEPDVTASEYTFTSNSGDLALGYVQGDDVNDGFKLNHFRARVSLDVVPEPSSALLVTLGGLALLRRRRA